MDGKWEKQYNGFEFHGGQITWLGYSEELQQVQPSTMAMTMAGPSLLYDEWCPPHLSPTPSMDGSLQSERSVNVTRSCLGLLAGQRDDEHSDVVTRAQFFTG